MPRRRGLVGVCARCPELTPPGVTLCVDCERARQRDVNRRRTRTASSGGYNTARWRRTRRDYLAAHPVCETPSCPTPARHVDHIDGQGPRGPRGHDPDNLQGLCVPCHSRKTALHDGGFGR